MAVPHARPMDIVDVRALEAGVEAARTTTLVKTNALELIRLVLPAREIAEHEVSGDRE